MGKIYDSKGSPISGKFDVIRGFKLPLSKQQMQALASQPLLAREALELGSGQYRLVLAVEDRVSGTLGIGRQDFAIP